MLMGESVELIHLSAETEVYLCTDKAANICTEDRCGGSKGLK